MRHEDSLPFVTQNRCDVAPVGTEKHEPVRVFILAEIRFYREGLAEILDRDPCFDVVGTAAGLEEALEQLPAIGPHVVLCDVAAAAGLEVLRMVVRSAPDLKVLALAVPDLEPEIIRCAEAGIAGWVTRSDSLAHLAASIESAARGEMLCTPRIAAGLLQRLSLLAAEQRPKDHAVRLTGRELQIVGLIHQGLSNKEIAVRLSIEVSTVKNHIHNVLEKLGARDRHEAVACVRVADFQRVLVPAGAPKDLDPRFVQRSRSSHRSSLRDLDHRIPSNSDPAIYCSGSDSP